MDRLEQSPVIDLSGKHIFVAGGGRGIGAATARMCAAAGAVVTVNYLSNKSAATAVVDQIAAARGQAWAVQGDVSLDGVADSAVAQSVERFGTLSGLVVSAGIFEPSPIGEMSVEFWDRTMAINLRGTFLAVRAAAQQMRSQSSGGSIVIYSSTAGQRGSAGYSAYATSKAGQIIFMRSMAKELAADRIRVNCVAPAWTDTDMAAPSLDEIGREAVARSFPLGRIGRPSDAAGASLYLLSDLAEFVTGSTVTVDGGMDMRG